MNGSPGAACGGDGKDTDLVRPITAGVCAAAWPELSTTGAAANESTMTARINRNGRRGWMPSRM